ncbi:MAG: hypothetical protein WA941_16880 [Nitrososphaeraceae archaeon]
MKAKVLAIPIIATVTLIAMIGIMSYSAQEVNAQNMTKMGKKLFA